MRDLSRNLLPIGLFLAGGVAGTALANAVTGPSSSQPPYVVRTENGVVTKAVLTVGDSVNDKPGQPGVPYRMVGIPDGLGAFDNGDGTFTLLMNHELGTNSSGPLGVVRAHGAKGAFVSRWTIDRETLQVLHGEDLILRAYRWNGTAYEEPTPRIAFNRFCSADLPATTAFHNPASGLGYEGRLFLNGEESGVDGRAFAHVVATGDTYELPRLGRFSWENAVARPASGDRTVVVGLDDGTGGQVYVYVGDKTASGLPVDRAGLTNGVLYGVKVAGYPAEIAATGIPSGTAFSLHGHGNVAGVAGAALDAASVAAQVTTFQRPEDGAWDPRNPNDFYFVTTASFTGKSRLWRLRFQDATNPALGGTIDMLLDGTEGPKMMDNLCMTADGRILVQEDPGNQSYVARIWSYDVADDTLTEVARHDEARFEPSSPPKPGFLTQDEESSGIIDASDILGEGKFLLVQQAHYNIGDAELVEGGQLLVMHVPKGKKVK